MRYNDFDKKTKTERSPILMDIITLINTFVSGLLNAEEEFLEHLDSFTMFEETVSRLSNQMAADFIGLALTNADRMICDSGIRKSGYTVQRRRQRTLISIVGDITLRIPCIKTRGERAGVFWMN